MKKALLFIAVALLSLNLIAQDNTSLWNLKYGSSMEQIEKQILKERGLEVDRSLSSSKYLIYANCKFSGEDVEFISLDFYNDKFYRAIVLITPSSQSLIFSTFGKIKNNLEEKYGKPRLSRSTFKDPYYEGDGYEIQAVKLDKANFIAQWQIPSSNPQNEIVVMVTNKVQVTLMYENLELSQKVKDKNNAEAIDDL